MKSERTPKGSLLALLGEYKTRILTKKPNHNNSWGNPIHTDRSKTYPQKSHIAAKDLLTAYQDEEGNHQSLWFFKNFLKKTSTDFVTLTSNHYFLLTHTTTKKCKGVCKYFKSVRDGQVLVQNKHVNSCSLLYWRLPESSRCFQSKFPHSQNVFLILLATCAKISPVFFCQFSTCLDSAHHSSPWRGSAFSQRFRTSSCCSWSIQSSNVIQSQHNTWTGHTNK